MIKIMAIGWVIENPTVYNKKNTSMPFTHVRLQSIDVYYTVKKERKKRVVYINCIAYHENQANRILDNIREGDRVYIEGSLKVNRGTVEQGYYHNIVINKIMRV